MVGFGSSLRIGRRAGWDAAYLDYETLKLILSQIEAVYEEEGHQSRRNIDGFIQEPDPNENTRRGKRKGRGDYRDDLFLESDSDAAFASSESDQEYSSESTRDLEPQRMESIAFVTGTQPTSGKFSLTYSTEIPSSSSEDSQTGDLSGKCVGGVPWRSEKTPVVKNQPRRPKPKKRFPTSHRSSVPTDYFVGGENNGLESFIMEEGDDQYTPRSTSSLFNTPFQVGVTSENTSLLSQSTNAQGLPSFHSFSTGKEVMTPTKESYGLSLGYQGSSVMGTTGNTRGNTSNLMGSDANALLLAQKTSPIRPTARVNEFDEERRRARRHRRRRRQARERKKREKKVPKHIRLAHSKARAITERFLGLLRAEVEKVTLFAQARLGELADTAGSLRFLSFEDTEFGEGFSTRRNSRPTSPYEHPLSDGGIHPSASSSSDDGGGGQGMFTWSDLSSEDEGSMSSNRPNIVSNFSIGALSSTTEQRSNLASRDYFSRNNRNNSSLKRGKDRINEAYEATRRQIQHFEHLRRERPIFQRHDHIVGEELLLVSAVDEADAYSAVGVELIHILKYICINVIAVRKICRKHDRLLMNRMLGGYYHRRRRPNSSIQPGRTLGGLIASVAGDIYEANHVLPGQRSNYKLVGVYDLKIQQLANSRTVKVVSSCLALALSEYEVSRTRADALSTLNSATKLKHQHGSRKADIDDSLSSFRSFDLSAAGWGIKPKESNDSHIESDSQDLEEDDEMNPPSTASSVSMTRLRFTVLSISALREASRIKLNPFATYLARSLLSFTGQAVVGEGLDGCSRETLDFLVAYCPDAALLLDSDTLYEGLKRGRWRQLSIGTAMRSSLAVALTGFNESSEASVRSAYDQEHSIMNALSILPNSEGIDLARLLEGSAPPLSTALSISRFTDFPPQLLRVHRFSYFLYTTNYYIVHPTANTFVAATGAHVAYSAVVIGASSFSAILAAMFQCAVLSRSSTGDNRRSFCDIEPFRRLLLVAAFTGLLGNIIHIVGIRKASVPISVLGRFILGLASSDIVHRQFVVTFVPSSLIVSESARLVQFQVLGLASGLALGSLAEIVSYKFSSYGVHSVQTSNWLMAVFWLSQFLRVYCGFQLPSNANQEHNLEANGVEVENPDVDNIVHADLSTDSSGSDPAPGPASIFKQSPKASNEFSPLPTGQRLVSDTPHRSTESPSIRHGHLEQGSRKRRPRRFRTLMKRIRKILSFNIAISIALAILAYATYSQEVLFTSCALITDRYFRWKGTIAGLFLGTLSALVLPIDYVCVQIARRYEERTVIKRSILILGLGLLIMINWGSVFALAANIRNLLTETKTMRRHYYDWLLGIAQYVIGFSITFIGMKALEGASCALLSKVSPSNLKSVVTNVGTIATFVGLFARVFADLQILTVGLSHRVINTDIVNALVVPMLMGCLAAYYFVRKHFFFLM